MRKSLDLFKSVFMAAACTVAFSNANAATYIAANSGSYTNASTWVGNVAPPTHLVADVVIIPSGITVTLNQNQILDGTLSTLTVNGTLDAPGNAIVLDLGSLTGSGTIAADSLSIGASLGLLFNGTLDANNMSTNGGLLTSGADVNVHGNLWLNTGLLNLAAGLLSLDDSATLVVNGGGLKLSGTGSANLGNNYNVLYVGPSVTAGWEAQQPGLNNVEVAVGTNDSVTLLHDLNVGGNLSLNSGTLALNGHLLAVGGSSNSGGGDVSTDNGSISITGSGGSLTIDSTNNIISNLTVNMPNSSNVFHLNGDATVNGTLNLQKGLLDIGSNTLTIGTSGTISGGTQNSYVTTDNNGKLNVNVNAGGSKTYPVGTMVSFAPAIITVNTGSTGGYIGVGITTGVYANGTSGTLLSNSQPMVNDTWHITGADSNLKVNLLWTGNAEVNGFDRTKLNVSQYTNGGWTKDTTTSATTSGGMYEAGTNTVANPNATLAVFGEGSGTGIKNIATASLVMYPNPAVNELHFASASNAIVSIYDIHGKQMKQQKLNGNTISIADLPSGLYNVVLLNSNTVSSGSFVKQ